MRKKYGRIVVFVFGCILAVWGTIIYPILNRGSIAFSFSNNTDQSFTVIRINDQEIDYPMEPGGFLTVDYRISEEQPLIAVLSSEEGELFEAEVTDDFTGLVSHESYGRVLVTVKEKKGNIELTILKNIS